jgi:hypothetical protein
MPGPAKTFEELNLSPAQEKSLKEFKEHELASIDAQKAGNRKLAREEKDKAREALDKLANPLIQLAEIRQQMVAIGLGNLEAKLTPRPHTPVPRNRAHGMWDTKERKHRHCPSLILPPQGSPRNTR